MLVSLSTNDSPDVCTAVKLTLSTPKVVIPVTLPPSTVTVPSNNILLPATGSNLIWPAESKTISPSATTSKWAAAPPSSTVFKVVAPAAPTPIWSKSSTSATLCNDRVVVFAPAPCELSDILKWVVVCEPVPEEAIIGLVQRCEPGSPVPVPVPGE